jgi:glycosyltransferase involved in cell wall biosynthesis
VAARVSFTGVVQRDEVARHVAAFDIALQPAVVAYASPLKLFEYLALGRAIVAPSQPNICEVLRDGENALLFDPKNSLGLVQAIRRLMGDADLRRRLERKAAETINEQSLTWVGNAKKVSALAERLIGRVQSH